MLPVLRVAVLFAIGAVMACGRPAAPVVVAAAPRETVSIPLPPPAFGEPQWQRGSGPPLTLTASDGSGLTLTRLVARAVVNAPLAFTEIALTFDNERDRAIEGTFSITLPPRAAITRFAMRTGETWQEGEVVELKAARAAYEDFLHRRQDPALLEQAAGNQFSARVFPIPARARKELIVSYAEELTGDAAYTLALKGLPKIDELDVSVSGGRGSPQSLRQTKITPTGDLVFDRRRAASRDGLRSGRTVVARVRPITDASPDPVRGLTILFDTSGSRALGFTEQTRLLGELVQKLTAIHGAFPLRVACFDQSVESVFDGASSAFGDRELLNIKARGALGASNLEAAFAWAREKASSRVIVVTDGVSTAGEADARHVHDAMTALRRSGVKRLDVVAVGGIRDESTLKSLAVGGFERDGVVASSDGGVDRLAKKLGATTRSGIAVRVEGAAFSYPERLDGVQPGDEALVYADVPEGGPVRITLGDAPAPELDLAPVDAPLLARAYAQARIASLIEEASRPEASPDLHARIVELAVAHRVVTPYTALLVLETDQDYARFGIERRGLANVLSVRDGKLVALSRSLPKAAAKDVADERALPPADSSPVTSSAAPTAAPPPPPPPPLESSPPPVQPAPATAHPRMPANAARPPPKAVEGLGLSGIGEGGGGRGEGIGLGSSGASGFGSGAGRLAGAHRSRAPSIRQGATQVTGRLPPEVIQRIVRQSFGRFRLCYENGLRSNPALDGRVSVRFVIDRTGAPIGLKDAGSTLGDPAVVQCVVRAFGSLTFPQPEGDVVEVVFPLTFTPAEAGEPALDKPADAEPYEGKLLVVMDRIAKKDLMGAKAAAQAWHDEDPGDVLGLVALGEALAANKETERAARAYGSIIDLFPARADMRRFAGSRLDGLSGGLAPALALDTYAKAKEQRPDHPASHRLHAWSLFRNGQPEKAFDAAAKALARPFDEDRFDGVRQILQEDVGLLGAAWAKAEPKRAAEISKRIRAAGGKIENAPSIRFVLTWETDANDVDFHIYDSSGGHAYYSSPHLPSGGDLYADITTGYGPECFTIRKPKAARASSYTLQANYYARGPMGYGMGKLQVIDHDGNGGLTFEEHPYVVMIDHAFVNLGVIKR